MENLKCGNSSKRKRSRRKNKHSSNAENGPDSDQDVLTVLLSNINFTLDEPLTCNDALKMPKSEGGANTTCEKLTPSNDSLNHTRSLQSNKHKKAPLNTSQYDDTLNKYPTHLDLEMLKWLDSIGVLFSTSIRINQKFSQEAYLPSPDNGQDIIVEGVRDRNRSLDGDEVYAIIKPRKPQKTKNGKAVNQLSAVVVGIKQCIHSRICIGSLSPFQKNSLKYATLCPSDPRLPKLRISQEYLPLNYKKCPIKFQDQLFATKILAWDDIRFAYGGSLVHLGTAGTATTETRAIILKYDLDITPYPETLNKYIPPEDYEIPQNVVESRLDCRSDCIFTIDPATAKDLDDAVSCELRSDGSFLVGVHISDVTYFLPDGTELDIAVSKRATTIYLVDAVYHMLPREMCALCSLIPGQNRLAFSVFWEFSPDGDIVGRRFCRTVINSCAQLSYEQVQGILDGSNPVLPPIMHGFTPEDIATRVRTLNKLARQLREARVANGALRIDHVKVSFLIDPLTGLPKDFIPNEQLDAHKLIEEFMLLANISVAEVLQEELPDLALLRQHSPPIPEYITRLQGQLECYGVSLDISSSGALQASISRLVGDSTKARAQLMVVNNALTKPMMRANYFCSKFVEDDNGRSHYALNIPCYTHFTSPIRRYADIMVHHLLGAVLKYRAVPKWTPEYVQRVAAQCNLKKYNAKLAGEASSELYFALYVGVHGSLVTEAVVCIVGLNSFESLVLSSGTQVRVRYNTIDGKVTPIQDDPLEVTVEWADGQTQKISMFSIVALELTRGKGISLEGHLLPIPVDGSHNV